MSSVYTGIEGVLTKSAVASPAPLYVQVKSYVLDRVARGELVVHARIPSENQLVSTLGVSRMTVNRALNDLTSDGVLVRTPGVGTFVAPQRPQTHPLEIRNIAEEVRARGHEYEASLIAVGGIVADTEQARDFQLPQRARLFRARLVHRENGIAVQYEDRLVNPAVAPGFLSEDFVRQTPYEHLMRVAPLQRAEHVLRAALPSVGVAEALEMAPGEPCLLLLRRTWSSDIVASCARLYYPASRYEFAGSAV